MRVQLQTQDLDPSEVHDISLSGLPHLQELLLPFTHLVHLTLVYMKPRLASFNFLPLDQFPSLRLLNVCDNVITIPEAPTKGPCLSLRRLLIANNALSSMEEVERLAVSFPKLEVLDLADNAIDTTANHISIFDSFPELSVLDSRDRCGEEVVVEETDESSPEYSSSSSDSDSSEVTDATEEDKSAEATNNSNSDADECEVKVDDSDGTRKKVRVE